MAKNRNTPAASPPASTPEAKEAELRERLFKEHYDELVKKQISNSENFDKSVLTLSASGLGLSLAFVKDVTPLVQAYGRGLLILSWGLFGVAIVATIASFMTSQTAIRFQMTAAHEYYICRNDEFLAKRSIASRGTDVLNFLAGVAFIAAIASTILFVLLNLPPSKI